MPPSNTNTEIALLKQETQYIKETVTRVEKNTTEWMARLEKKQDEQHKLLYDMMKWILDTFPEKFATKDEHNDNSKKIEKISEWMSSINLKIASVSWLVSWGCAVIIFLINKIW